MIDHNAGQAVGEDTSGALVLIIDDDPSVSSLLEGLLEGDGFRTKAAASLFQAEGILARADPDLIILDRKLSDGDGVDLCRRLRAEGRQVPILMLSATKKSVPDRVTGLETGADDYLGKPFSGQELLSRVKAILRRCIELRPEKTILEAGPLRLDLDGRRAYLRERELELSGREFDLLAVFVKSRSRVVTREFLMESVWGSGKELDLTSNVVDVMVHNLRTKLNGFGESISTVRGFGFRFDPRECPVRR